MEISSSESKIFIDNNHLKGNCPASVKLGLFYNKGLIAVMTFGKKRMILGSSNSEGQYEMIRFCTIKGTSVIGGASKLIKYFELNYNPKILISYADMDISKGNIYQKTGFELVSKSLNFWWFKGDIKYHRSNFMKHKIKKNPLDDRSAKQIMESNGFFKIWGTGNLKFQKIY